jgi:hypothetical protein
MQHWNQYQLHINDSMQGAIMAVGASRPSVVADKDGFFSIKNEMLVSLCSHLNFEDLKYLCNFSYSHAIGLTSMVP